MSGRVADLPPFRPMGWLRGAHRQTLCAGVGLRVSLPELRHERLELGDGDFLDLARLEGAPGAPLVVVLHGMQGSLRSPYAGITLSSLAARGLAAAFVHFRGCSGVPNRLARGYHSGETGDLKEVLAHLRAEDSSRALGAVGFSLGGNALAKSLAEEGRGTPLQAAVVVSAPLDLAACAAALDEGPARIYRRWLLEKTFPSVRAKRALLEGAGLDVDQVLASGTLRELDDRLTAPLHGFRGASDYYARASAGPLLPAIERPTLLVHARDDPFMTPAVAPTPERCSSSIELAVSDHGGHVGFLASAEGPGARLRTKLGPGVRAWLGGPPLDWLEARLRRA